MASAWVTPVEARTQAAVLVAPAGGGDVGAVGVGDHREQVGLDPGPKGQQLGDRLAVLVGGHRPGRGLADLVEDFMGTASEPVQPVATQRNRSAEVARVQVRCRRHAPNR